MPSQIREIGEVINNHLFDNPLIPSELESCYRYVGTNDLVRDIYKP
jgi:hypothetical protein